MSENNLEEILLLCVSIERKVADVYERIALQTEDTEQKAFWIDVSDDEKRHAEYWQKILSYSDREKLGDILERPDEIKSELESMKLKIDEILEKKRTLPDLSSAIRIAYTLEAMLLNPAFAILFYFLKKETGIQSPFDEYQEHIDKFAGFVNTYAQNPELELLHEILSSIWKHNRGLAENIAEIKTLRGMLPICASCKKIRDDKGYWNQIESYLSDHSEILFSHSICPECARKLYPDFFDDKNNKNQP